MELSLLRPAFLLLLPAIALLWFLPRRLRDRTQGVLRSLVFLAIVLALARPVLVTSDDDPYHVFVIDESASVSPERQQRLRAAVTQALAQATDRDRTSAVIVGETANPETAAVLRTAAVKTTEQIDDRQSRSPLSAALAAAIRQIPEGGRGVIHLFSDGLATDRRWAPDVQHIIERGIAVNTYDAGLDDSDVYPAGLRTDDLLRVGQTVHADVDVVGVAKGLRVRLVAAGGEEIAVSAPVDSDGRVTVPLTFEPKRAGFLNLSAEVVAAAGQDSNPRNNELRRTLAIQEPLRVLYLGDRVEQGAGRLGELVGRGFDLTDGSRVALNAGLDSSAYDLVLLDDRPASKVPEPLQQQLADAVSEKGMGLVFSGGKAAFGTGGYEMTPLATIVPVEFVQRTEKRDPSTALAIIMDTSGSMTGSRIELCKQVARLAVRRLKAHDRIGIVEFYGNKHWALPLQSAANKITIDRAIGRMQAVGGTVMMPAIEEAYYGLKNVDTRYKHILIITDAGVEESNYESMVRMITKDGVNVSTVLVGAQAHNQFLIDVASWGKGRFYSAVDRYSLPELILKQPSTMKLPAYKTGTFTVRSRGGEGWWSDVNRRAMPALDGYVETSTRPGAEVLMEVDGNEHPLLATWRYGLGSVTALMTEPVGEGTRRWGDWRDYGRLLARIFTRTADDARLFRYDVSRTDHVVTVTARRYSRDSTLYPQAVVLDEQERETGTLRFRQLAPEHFSARLTVDPSADVRLSAAAYSGPASRGQQPTRLISTASDDAAPEQQVDPEQGLDLEALATATGGRYTDADAVAAGRLDVAAPASASSSPPALGSLSVIRLWPLLLMLGLLLYLAELVYRRSTWPATRRAARTVSA